jgi:hypothetical protein
VRPKGKLGSHISCSQECKKMWGSEPSQSQVNSHFGSWSPKWILKFSKSDDRGQNSLDWIIIYIIGKIWDLKCLKWARMTHLDIWNTSYGQKKGWESNWQFDSRPPKVRNHPNFLLCRWCATYHWKTLNESYKFALDLISIGGLHAKLWAPKVEGISIVRILGFPLGSPRTKCHLDVVPMANHKIYYKGEGGGFPQVRAVVNLVNSSSPVTRPKTKSASTMH